MPESPPNPQADVPSADVPSADAGARALSAAADALNNLVANVPVATKGPPGEPGAPGRSVGGFRQNGATVTVVDQEGRDIGSFDLPPSVLSAADRQRLADAQSADDVAQAVAGKADKASLRALATRDTVGTAQVEVEAITEAELHPNVVAQLGAGLTPEQTQTLQTVPQKVDAADLADLTGATGWPYVQNGALAVLSDAEAQALIGGGTLSPTAHPVWSPVPAVTGDVGDPALQITLDGYVAADGPVTYSLVGTPQGVALASDEVSTVATFDRLNAYEDAVAIRATYSSGGDAVVLVDRLVVAPPATTLGTDYDLTFDGLTAGETIIDADPLWSKISGSNLTHSTHSGRVSVLADGASLHVANVGQNDFLVHLNWRNQTNKFGGIIVGCDAQGQGGIRLFARKEAEEIQLSGPALTTGAATQPHVVTHINGWNELHLGVTASGQVTAYTTKDDGTLIAEFTGATADPALMGTHVALESAQTSYYIDRIRITTI